MLAFSDNANAVVYQFYWKDNANNGNWDWGGSQWYGTNVNNNVGAPTFDGGAQLYFENTGNTTTTINNAGSGGGAPSGWIALNGVFTQNASTGKVYTINSGGGINGIYLYNKIETLAIGTAAGLIINSQVQLGGTAEINAVAANIGLGNLLLNGNTLNAYGNKQLNITGVISGGGTFNIKNQGLTATYSGAGANTFSGGTTVENSSTLVLNKSANTAAIAGTLTINSGAIVRTDAANQLSNQLVTVNGTLNLNNNNQSAALAGSGTVTLGSGTLTINNTGTDTFSGGISGTGGLTKSGAGTQILSSTNTYGGTTSVSQGILQVNGSITGTGAVNVASGATLGGTGSIAGAINVTGVLAPGASIESLGTGAVSFLAGSTLAYELNSTSLNGDLVDSTGTLDIASGAILTLSQVAAGTLSNGSKLTLIDYMGGWTSAELFTYNGTTLNDDSTFTLGANQWFFNYNDSTGGSNFSADQSGATSFVTMTVIPEPASAALGLLGSLLLLRRRRV